MGGGDVPVHYLWEDNGLNQALSDSTAKVPGADPRITTLEARNNGRRLILPGSRIAYDIEPGAFDGSFAITGGLTNPWWARSIYGSPSTSGSGPDYTHTYSGIDPDPFRIIEGYDFDASIAERIIKGCVTARFTIDPTVDQLEYAPFQWEGFYVDEETDENPGSLTSTPTPSNDALSAKDATLNVAGSAETVMRNASLELALNTRQIVGFGSRFAIDFFAGMFEPSVNYSKIKPQGDVGAQKDVYGGSTSMQEDIATNSFSLDFSNGKSAGSGINEVDFTNSSDSFPDAFGENNIGDPESPIEETLERLIENIDVVATNETSTAP